MSECLSSCCALSHSKDYESSHALDVNIVLLPCVVPSGDARHYKGHLWHTSFLWSARSSTRLFKIVFPTSSSFGYGTGKPIAESPSSVHKHGPCPSQHPC
uniref:Uncharacterized protein n=1 Tax=Eutreptiella gymnastica TaxID=73025 RepID=A0A7S4GJY1_9EUGL